MYSVKTQRARRPHEMISLLLVVVSMGVFPVSAWSDDTQAAERRVEKESGRRSSSHVVVDRVKQVVAPAARESFGDAVDRDGVPTPPTDLIFRGTRANVAGQCEVLGRGDRGTGSRAGGAGEPDGTDTGVEGDCARR